MTEKLDVRLIIVDHLRTLRGESGSLRIDDVLVFFALPLLAALLHFAFAGGAPIGRETKIDEILVASFSIFAALLLNIQVFLLGTPGVSNEPLDKIDDDSSEDRVLLRRQIAIQNKFLDELFANIAYAILISVGVVFFTLVAVFFYVDQFRIIKAVQFCLVLHFSMTLLMIMKRIHALFSARKRRK